jgi:DNA-binding PadR family transcriptional regulator
MNAPTLFDVPNIHNEDTCSRNRVQAAILRELGRANATAYELQQWLGDFDGIHVALNSVGSRLNELAKKGLIEKADDKRPGRFGRPLTVWRIK